MTDKGTKHEHGSKKNFNDGSGKSRIMLSNISMKSGEMG